ncbi:MAG: DUF6261 family protein [Prevotellaceae bacterium]|nr:DUF6261 family protein [Prevotellaceae bacterium]
MRIYRINLRYLRNEEMFNFFTEFKAFVEETSPETLDVTELFATFLVVYGLIDEAMESTRKSAYSESIIELNSQRGETYRCGSLAVQSATCHFDPTLKEAGKTLIGLFERFGNLASRPYNEQTGGIINFIQEARGSFAPSVQTLALAGHIDELERRNNAFQAAVLGRNREAAVKPILNMPDLRNRAIGNYSDMIDRVDARMLLHGDERIESFIKLLNTNIERYKVAMKRRKGRKDTKEQAAPEAQEVQNVQD